MNNLDGAVAVIGIACRFPQADDPRQLWRNLCDGLEAIRFFSDEELFAAGVEPDALRDPGYVKAAPIVDSINEFDADFFGFTPREAEILDPQQRVLLECAYRALEDAGHARMDRIGDVGVYVGVSSSSYLQSHLATRPDIIDSMGVMALSIANDKDFVASQIAYRLGFTGPAVNIATACSTSLVAIHTAYNAVLNFECDVALAGGASIRARQVEGYQYMDGGVLSPDGRCRPFSAGANGTIGGSGAGIVVLKRLADAQADGDAIYAVIAGSAVNNDGSDKLGFTAPSVTGQAKAIREAMAVAGVSSSEIGYVEAHGTATTLGDPVEFAALSAAHGHEAAQSRCAIGSIKSNFGHLDAAAGVAGFIKATLAVEHGEIPPSLHFDAPNPQIDFAASRFFVADRRQPWPLPGPRRAGVSSFGIGGTNAHVILQQQAADPGMPSPRAEQLFVISAKSPRALDAGRGALAGAIAELTANSFADASYTLIEGRPELAQRAAFVGATREHALAAASDGSLWIDGCSATAPKVAWLFPGQGAQHVDMGRALYEQEPVFRDAVDSCASWMRRHADWDPIALLYPADAAQRERAELLIGQTRYTQTALFIVEYALAQLWRSLGHTPDLMLGHSLGEYVAACIAGVMDPHDALRLIEGRARLVGDTPPGAMLSVALDAQALRPLLLPGVELAVDLAPELCVVGGTCEAIAAMEATLADAGAQYTRIDVSHAFHTSMLDPVLDEFRMLVASIALRAPTLRFVSCTSGRVVEADEVCDPDYWVRHLREPVDFRAALHTLAEQPGVWRFLDLGPSGGAASIARRNGIAREHLRYSLPRERETGSARHQWLMAVGQLWAEGVALDLSQLHAGEMRRRMHLPGYVFARTRHWVDPADHASLPVTARTARHGALPLYRRAWTSDPGVRHIDLQPRSRLVFDTAEGLVAHALDARGFILVHEDDAFQRIDGGYRLNPGEREEMKRLFATIAADGAVIEQIIFGWPLAQAHAANPDASLTTLQNAFAALVASRKQAAPGATVELVILVRNAFQIGGADPVAPAQRALAAMATVVAQEEGDWRCRVIDVGHAVDAADLRRALADDQANARLVALRGATRWVPSFERLARAAPHTQAWKGKVVVIVGGLGTIGSALAGALAQREAVLVLVGRRQETELDATVGAHLQQLRAGSGQVAYRNVDIGDSAALGALLRSVCDTHGSIDLLLHAAAAMGADALMLTTDSGSADFERHNRAKIAGTAALISATQEVAIERVVLMSSLAATLGGLGMSAYAAANAFMDGLVEAPWRWPLRGDWYAIGWDGLAAEPAGDDVFGAEDVLALIEALVANHAPGLYLASRRDLNQRWFRWGTRTSVEASPSTERVPARGDIMSLANDVERIVADAFEALIGIRPIGATDDFFGLGGDSLLATQLCSRLRQRCQVDLAISAIFEHPVVEKLAAHIIALQGAATIGDDEVLALVRSLDSLDEAALAELLAE